MNFDILKLNLVSIMLKGKFKKFALLESEIKSFF